MVNRNTHRPGRKKGTPKTGGRQRGTPNKATVEVKEVCATIVEDPRYRARLLARARAGELPAAVECMLWYYRFGKPRERFEADVGESLYELLGGKPLPTKSA